MVLSSLFLCIFICLFFLLMIPDYSQNMSGSYIVFLSLQRYGWYVRSSCCTIYMVICSLFYKAPYGVSSVTWYVYPSNCICKLHVPSTTRVRIPLSWFAPSNYSLCPCFVGVLFKYLSPSIWAVLDRWVSAAAGCIKIIAAQVSEAACYIGQTSKS